jgi:pyocin large subunit-like protein
MPRCTRRRRAALLLAAVMLACALFVGCGRETTARSPAGTTASQSTVSRPDVGFRSKRRFEEHYVKHGREFGSVSKEEYLRLAQTLRDAPVGGPVLEIVRNDGTITRFDRESGGFIAFERDGIIRTFFRPNDGEGYFKRQARR